MKYILNIPMKVVEQQGESDEDRQERVKKLLGDMLTYGLNIMGDKMMQHGIKLESTGELLKED